MLRHIKNTLQWALIGAAVVAMLAAALLAPFAPVWALNRLSTDGELPYSFETWLAVVILYAFLQIAPRDFRKNGGDTYQHIEQTVVAKKEDATTAKDPERVVVAKSTRRRGKPWRH